MIHSFTFEIVIMIGFFAFEIVMLSIRYIRFYHYTINVKMKATFL